MAWGIQSKAQTVVRIWIVIFYKGERRHMAKLVLMHEVIIVD